ncbi:MAG: hypothetical protein JO053_10385, partial [Acidobacteria bacterium]|nr:hypothetical protein [Acidobacteriota bacterium]
EPEERDRKPEEVQPRGSGDRSAAEGSEVTPPKVDLNALFNSEINKLADEQAKKNDNPFNFDGVSLKSVLETPAPEFKQHVYDRILPQFKQALSTLNEPDIQSTMGTFLRKLSESSSVDTVRQLQPYVVKFFEDHVLPKNANGSITEEGTQDDADRGQSDRNGEVRHADEGSADVRGADGKRNSGKGSKGSSKGGTRNGLVSEESGDNGNDESRGSSELSGATSEGQPSTKSGEGSGDSTGDGVLAEHHIERRDYVAPQGSLAREGSWKQAAKNNLDIIELVKKLDAEGRDATPEEQKLLAKYTGWGASELANNIFAYYPRSGWEELHARAKELLSEDEYKVARQTTQYAHYTSEPVIRGIWDAIKQLGFQHGTILEPGMGIGLFPVAAPKALMDKSRYTGVEMDPLTARIAHYLLPDQAILHNDFVKQKLPKNHFDVAIGNPPFADIKITDDPEYKKLRLHLHDYFFAKSLDRVKPGGLLVFVTSKGTMDKQNDKARQYMADKADLLGAIRMPQTAFKENAGTEVVTDVLFFRKRLPGEEPAGQAWTDLKPLELTYNDKYRGEQTVTQHINEYYVDHPEMVLGKHSLEGSMYGPNQYTVEGRGDIDQQFRDAIKNLPSGVFAGQKKSQDIVQKTYERDWDPKAKKEGSLYVHDDGRLMIRESGAGVEVDAVKKLSPSEKKWLTSYVGLRDALKQAQYDQLHAEDAVKEGEVPTDWEASLKTLNDTYDAFVKKHGNILAFTDTERKK